MNCNHVESINEKEKILKDVLKIIKKYYPDGKNKIMD